MFPLPTACLLSSLAWFSLDLTFTSYYLYGLGLTVFILFIFVFVVMLFLYLGFSAICSKALPSRLSVAAKENTRV
jgi:hypothetical protein